MYSNNVDKISYIVFFIGTLLCIYIFIVLSQEGKSYIEVSSAVGSVASVFGLIIAILQIVHIRSTSEAAKKAAQNAHSEIYNFISIAEVSSAIKMLDEIKRYLRNGSHEAAELRMSDLRSDLARISKHEKMENIPREEKFDNIVRGLGREVISLNKTINDPSKTYKTDNVIENLEKAKGILCELEYEITFDKNGNS